MSSRIKVHLPRRFRASVRLALAVFLLTGMGFARTTHAQTKDATTNATADNAQDVVQLFVELDDLGELRVINPLKLTADEMGKLITVIADSQTEYNKKLAATAAPIMRKVAENIHAARKKALAGAVLSSDDTILKAMTDYGSEHKKLDDATLIALSAKLQTILTEDQVKAASKVARDEQTKLNGSASKGSDAQWFNLYVLRVIIGYARIVPLLKEMKAAHPATTSAATPPDKAPEKSGSAGKP